MPIATSATRSRRHAFTLVEILIVVVILGILAAIVIPQFANASSSARDSAAKTILAEVRGQLELYKSQHLDTYPPLSSATGWNCFTLWTNTTGSTTAVADSINYPYGPYMQGPGVNPYNKLTAVTNDAVNSAAGWYYTTGGNNFTFYARDTNGNSITTY